MVVREKEQEPTNSLQLGPRARDDIVGLREGVGVGGETGNNLDRFQYVDDACRLGVVDVISAHSTSPSGLYDI